MIEFNSIDVKNVISCKYEVFYNEDSTHVDIRIVENGHPLSDYLYNFRRTANGVVEYYCFSDTAFVFVDGKTYKVGNPFPNVYQYEEFHSLKTVLCTENTELNNLKTISKEGVSYKEDIEYSYKEYCVLNDSIGTLKRFVQNNIVYQEGYYLKNKRNGPWKYYNECGSLTKIESYFEGELMKTELY